VLHSLWTCKNKTTIPHFGKKRKLERFMDHESFNGPTSSLTCLLTALMEIHKDLSLARYPAWWHTKCSPSVRIPEALNLSALYAAIGYATSEMDIYCM
jgi:hypothetical protein